MEIDYIEFVVRDIDEAKRFYGSAFAWGFTDYGTDYASFDDGRLTGGFAKGQPASGGPLVILRADRLEAAREAVVTAGGKVVKEIFAFPGGRRFHFTDPSGNTLAVWGE